MGSKFMKSLLVAVFSVFSFGVAMAEEGHEPAQHEAGATHEEKLDPGKIIIEHVTDAHDFHFMDIGGKAISIPLPVILYSEGKWHMFSSGNFHHGHEAHDGFFLVNDHYIQQMKAEGVDVSGLKNQQIIAVDAEGKPNASVQVYDFSMTKNVVQMLLASILLIVLMSSIAKKYAKNGPNKAPSGFQNAVEPVITFVRDEVAKPNLHGKYQRYLPFLLTVFFFILINNLFGLIPGSANVTGNLALTAVLALISFIVILFSTNKHFWGHVFWFPGVPVPVKLIMLPVELMGIFTKPFALMIRLFANMVAGHVIILSFIILIFIFGAMSKSLGYGTSPIFVGLAVFIYAIEVLVAFIQAFIFTNLTAVFIGQAFEHGDHHEGGHH
ncbi:F0F1 ATP synthase subunit A [Phnomibacter ginsenosidimutans]|uniref:ATP synthase subunit a n=2 Tax=Phnomibacter ginsenosidimutans TaxID=2676868 RepID=A0A6I6G501_9BACT|nr:F0F1 ATP synthase subunit A [Phnomibacter ginsenosidimutans]